MGLGFSTADIVRFKQRTDSLSAKARAALAKADQAVETVITTSEVSAAAFLFGLAQGKFGGVAIVGVPVDLLAGLGLHIAAFAGIGGRNAHHLHAFADGALGSFFNALGRTVGRQLQTEADVARMQARSSFALMGGETTGGASLADEELARMVAAGRR